MHPFELIARVLGVRLREEQASPELRSEVGHGSRNWVGTIGQASRHYVLAAFAAAMAELELTGGLEPDLQGFLAAFYAANGVRNRLLRRQLSEVTAVLDRIAVAPVLLKGAIRLVDGLYPDISWRMMRDLDLLVPAPKLAEAVASLRRIGYAEIPGDSELEPSGHAHHHHPRLLRPHRPAPVELHTELFSVRRHARLRHLLPVSELLADSLSVMIDGAMARLPSTNHQLIHLIGHCQIAHGGHACGSILLSDRLEAAALAQRATNPIDWDGMIGRFAVLGYRRPLVGFLLSLRDGGLYRAPLPERPDVLTRLQQHRLALQARSGILMDASVRMAARADSVRRRVADFRARTALGSRPSIS